MYILLIYFGAIFFLAGVSMMLIEILYKRKPKTGISLIIISLAIVFSANLYTKKFEIRKPEIIMRER